MEKTWKVRWSQIAVYKKKAEQTCLTNGLVNKKMCKAHDFFLSWEAEKTNTQNLRKLHRSSPFRLACRAASPNRRAIAGGSLVRFLCGG